MNKGSLLRLAAICLVACAALCLLWNASSSAAIQKDVATKTHSSTADDPSTIYLNAAHINVNTPEAQSLRTSVDSFAGKRLHLVKFSGPIQPGWVKSLRDNGLQIVDYIPNYTYLVYGDAPGLQRMQTTAFAGKSPIEWDGDYKSEYRISPDIYKNKTENGLQTLASDQFQIQLIADPETNPQTLELIKSLSGQPIKGQQAVLHYVNLVVGLTADAIQKIADQPDVISIHPYLTPKKLDERQDIILAGNLSGNGPSLGTGYLQYLADHGFTQAQFDASNFVVDVSDSGIDVANTTQPNQFLLYKNGDPSGTSRFAYSRLIGTPSNPSSLQGCDGHGNLNATIVAGYVPSGGIFAAAPHADLTGYKYGLGVAPFARVGSSVIFDPDSFTNPNYANLQSAAYNDGARISSNSWGSTDNSYSADAQAYDALVRDAQPTGSTFATAGNQEMVILFSAGNSGSGPGTVGSPGTGKNVITVGASEGVQAFSGSDGCGVGDTNADSANDIISFSSRGPTSDGRSKPDIVLPGTHITGGVAQSTFSSTVSGTGSQLACFNGDGVCGGVGGLFFPAGQQWYTASSGTSHSTPAVSGLSALIRQHFINQGLTPPSPAMTKAIILNSARYMTGNFANDTLPSNSQGMGMADMNNYFDIFSGPNIIRDEVNADRFTASGQTRIYAGTIPASNKPFKVTLAWTDAPGSTTGNASVNNLDLEVTVGGQTYLGNVFNGANSSTGGSADTRNNVESVFIPAGVTGTFVIKVKATNIAGDGVPNNADPLDQDFALVTSNANVSPVPVEQVNSLNITAENFTPANSVPDPGETLSVDLNVSNIGTANSTATTVTLQATGGVQNPSGAQNYGALVAGGASVTKSFSFKVNPALACGSQITLTFLIQDGATGSSYSKTYLLGVPAVTVSQNFDGVTAPALPAGWTQNQLSGAGITWTTSATSPVSGPNDAFANDPGAVNETALTTPAFTVNSAAAVLTFKNSYNTEASSNPAVGYDGMVLEIKIGAGSFQDILTAGGSFNTGGYNRTIDTPFLSPIAGRQAWSGNSGGYIDTSVNLPASANGQSVQLRWVMASDQDTTGVGVRLDDIQITAGATCSTTGPPAINKTPFDFDGDHKTDLSVFRPSTGEWWIRRSQTGNVGVVSFGQGTDQIVPADFTGDGKTDIAFWRPSTGQWFIVRSENGSFFAFPFGTNGDIPAPADYDGDGKADPAVFRPSTGTWFIQKTTGGTDIIPFGRNGDIPVVGDYDGDGKADIAIFRPSGASPGAAEWWIRKSSGAGVQAFQFGISTDKAVPGDYTGDGKTDVAIYRPGSPATWFVLRSENFSFFSFPFGTTGDVPVLGDYDNDGKWDAGVFRPSSATWFVNQTGGGTLIIPFGLTPDRAVPNAYVAN